MFVPWLGVCSPSGWLANLAAIISAEPGASDSRGRDGRMRSNCPASQRTALGETLEVPTRAGTYFLTRGESARRRRGRQSIGERVGARSVQRERAARSAPHRANAGRGGRRRVGRAGVSRRGAPFAHRARPRRCTTHAGRRSDRHRLPKPAGCLMALDALLDAVERLPAFIEYSTRCRRRASGWSSAVFPDRLTRPCCRGAGAAAADAILRRRRGRRRRGGTLACRSQTLLTDAPIALYPAREGFGEAEPHMEVAGERVETLERLTRGELRILLTTGRALLEKTRMPRALARSCASSCARATRAG